MTALAHSLAEWFAHPLWQRAVWTLLHSLWQGAGVAIIVALILRSLPASRARARHAVALAGLASIALALPITFAALTGYQAWVDQRPTALASTSTPVSASTPPIASVPVPTGAQAIPPTTTTPSPISPPSEKTNADSPLIAWAALLWLLGTTLMLLRTAYAFIATRSLLCTPALPELHPITRHMRDIALRLDLARPVRIAQSERVRTPCVAGLLKPIILLPAIALTNLDEAQLRAIIAHELAHILRNDLVVALLQRITESLLFFNPAALWLGRQLRIEREACCDALAAEAIGDAHSVARTLAHVAEVAAASRSTVPFPAAALAMSGPQESPLILRIRRLLLPNEILPARLPWPSFLAVATVSFASLFTLTLGAAEVGEQAARLLNPEERIQQVRDATDDFSQQIIEPGLPENMVTISGRVRTADNAPLPKDLRVAGSLKYQMRPNASSMTSIEVEISPDGSFSESLMYGEIALWAQARGFAPAGVETLKPEPGATIDDIELVIGPGYSAALRILQPNGTPLPDVEVEKHQVMGNAWLADRTVSTNQRGLITFENLANAPVRLSVRHPGFEAESIEVTLDPDEPYTWTLTPTEPLVVTLLDRSRRTPLGFAPLANAEILGAFDTSTTVIHEPRSRSRDPVLATTDEQGRFTLDSLRKDARYVFWVRWEDNYQLTPMLSLADSPERIVIDPPLWITAMIRGDLSKLEQRDGQPLISFIDSWRFQDDASHSYGAGHEIRVPLDPETRLARIGPLVAQEDVTIKAANVSRTIDPRMIDRSRPIVIDLDIAPTEAPSRSVVIDLVPPEGWPPPQGTIRVAPVDPTRNIANSRDIEVVDGRARISVPLDARRPGGGMGRISILQPIDLPGYTFGEQHAVDVPHGDRQLIIPVPVQPAGTVVGRVTMPDGSPAGRVFPTIYTVERAPGNAIVSPHSESTNDGRFVVNAIPIGGIYRIGVTNAGDHEHRILSDEFRFTEDNLTHEIVLQFVEGQTVTVEILDPDGAPARNANANLYYSTPYRHSHSGINRPTGPDGRITWRNVNPDLPGEYSIQIEPTSDTVGVNEPVDFAANVQTIRLRRGVLTTGRVIDADTGLPIPEFEFSLQPDFIEPQQSYRRKIEARTDREGRFSFRNLEPFEYMWNSRDATGISISYTDAAGDEVSLTPRHGAWLPLQPGILDQAITVRLSDHSRPNHDTTPAG